MLIAGGGIAGGDTFLGLFTIDISPLPTWGSIYIGSAFAGGSAINGSEPTFFMGLFNFSAANPITRTNWDVGSASYMLVFRLYIIFMKYYRE